ncbi:MAG: hypothetical protein PVSMB1_11610 [Gemmatimonadaceae bacterium]
MPEPLPQFVERFRPHRAPLTAEYHKAYRPVELGNLRFSERTRDFFRETKSGHTATFAIAVLHVVVDLDIAITNPDVGRQTLKEFSGLGSDEAVRDHGQRR